MKHKKVLGWGVMALALIVLVLGETVPGAMSLFVTFGAMLIGGIGIYLACDDAP